MIKVKIPIKMPSLNEYIYACKIQRGYWNLGNQMKHDIQEELYNYLYKLPKLQKPIRVHFTWVEKNKRRDLDNISAAGHKFILDALQMCGRLKNDNLNYIVGLSDDYIIGNDYAVIMEIEEMKVFEMEEKNE